MTERRQPIIKPAYLDDPTKLRQESDRLRTFAIPSEASIRAIGAIPYKSIMLDFGAGENPDLGNFAKQLGAKYATIDIRPEAIQAQRENGATAVQADLLDLPTPIGQDFATIAHTRFVLGHFPDMVEGERSTQREQIVRNTFRTVEMGGTPAVEALRDLVLGNIKNFDAAYGAKSAAEIGEMLEGEALVQASRFTPPLQTDYSHVLRNQEVTLRALERQDADPQLIGEMNWIFDDIRTEAASDDAPGYRMPNIAIVTATKLPK